MAPRPLPFLAPPTAQGQRDPEVSLRLAAQVLLSPRIALAGGQVRAIYRDGDVRLLRALIELARYHVFSVSRHQPGVGFDVDVIDGNRVSLGHRTVRTFMDCCRKLGASDVRGPGDPGHDGHVHAAWSLPRRA